MTKYLLFMFCIFTSACNTKPEVNNDETTLNLEGPGPEIATKVLTISATQKVFEYNILTEGKLRSADEQSIIARLDGEVLNAAFKTGDRVKKGDLLVLLDTVNFSFDLERSRLTWFASEKEYESQLLGYGKLLKNSSEKEAWAIKKKLRISSGLADAELKVKEYTFMLAKRRVIAPFSGILTNVEVQKGEHVKAGQELMRVYNPDALLLETRVLETDLALLKTGIPADIRSVADPEIIHHALVYEINPYVEDDGMVAIKLILENEHKRNKLLFPGMNCSVTIRVPTQKNIVIPRQAVILKNQRPVVFTCESGLAKWNYVKTGRDNGQEIEILDGLSQGSHVIVSGNLRLGNDSPVEEIGSKQ